MRCHRGSFGILNSINIDESSPFVNLVADRRLSPGTFVHARVNLHNRDQVSVQPVEPPPLPRQFWLWVRMPGSFGVIDFNQY